MRTPLVVIGALAAACSGESDGAPFSADSGRLTGSGGGTAGSTGGSGAATAANGGNFTTASGGAATTESGGAPSLGGAGNTRNTSGGTRSFVDGGRPLPRDAASDGRNGGASGASTSTGGVPSGGGNPGSGGDLGTGGAVGSGGALASGGAVGSGGTLGTGGAVGSGGTGTGGAGTGTAPNGCTAGVGQKPNFVFVVTDDLDKASFDLLLKNGKLPNIQNYLVSHGTRFENAFVGNSLCCPSRATFLTGQYSHNNKVISNNNGFGQFTPHQNDSLGTHLKAAGYRTAYFGKYLNGYTNATYHAPGWDEWQALLEPSVYYMWGFKLVKSINGAAPTTVTYNGGSTAESATNYQTDVLAQLGSTFIGSAASPFALVVMALAPHVEVLPSQKFNTYSLELQLRVRPAQRHYGLLRAKTAGGAIDDYTPISSAYDIPRKTLASYNEADVSDKPSWLQNGPEGGGGWPLIGAQDLAYTTRQYLDRLESMLAVDDMVGTLHDALAAKGILDDTVLVFTSDNGFELADHRLNNKMFPYDESIRVPMVASCGAPNGAVEARYASNIDFSPTAADYAGAAAGWTNMDGRSLRGIIEGRAVPAWRSRVLVEHWFDPNGPIFNDVPDHALVRTSAADATPEHKYIEYYGLTGALNQTAAPDDVEEYALASDPAEVANAATNASYAAARASLAPKLQNLRTCAMATCRSAEDAP